MKLDAFMRKLRDFSFEKVCSSLLRQRSKFSASYAGVVLGARQVGLRQS